MVSNYDLFAQEYKNSKEHPFRIYLEKPTIFSLLGELEGKDVIDLACGDGIYTRAAKRLGARKTLGVDISKEMIKLAETEEQRAPLSCEYLVSDILQFTSPQLFDVAIASYLFNYADSFLQLLKMAEAASRCLRPGGMLVAFNDNPFEPPFHLDSDYYAEYGFKKRFSNQNDEQFTKIIYTLSDVKNNSEFTIENYWHPPKDYEMALRETGFFDLTWIKPSPSTEGIEKHGIDYWNRLIKHPAFIGFCAMKIP